MSCPRSVKEQMFRPFNIRASAVFYVLSILLSVMCCRAFVTIPPSPPSKSFRDMYRRPSKILLFMGMKVNIRIVGRKSGSEKWLDDASTMYENRLRPSNVQVETTWHKDNPGLLKGIEADRSKGHSVVLLDPLGKTKTSEKFSENMYEWLDRGGSRLSFVIGGAEGLPPQLKYPPPSDRSPKLEMISLSELTFTHQFARILLIEQIYRATEIRKGSGYHK